MVVLQDLEEEPRIVEKKIEDSPLFQPLEFLLSFFLMIYLNFLMYQTSIMC